LKLYSELPVSAQAAYSGLDIAAKDAERRRSIAALPGGFARKIVKGRTYWYYQYKNPDGVAQQFFVGPDDAATQVMMARHAAPEAQQSTISLRQLSRSAIELGCASIPVKHGRVIGRLLDHGFFNSGGLLVGTHAFLSYQNMFGVRWGAGAFTLDLDLTHAGRNVTLAIAPNVEMDAANAVGSLGMGFIPVKSGTIFKKRDEADFDLDFLTTLGRTRGEPLYLPALNLNFRPLKFMELSLEDPMKSTLLLPSGPLVVNIPRPHRYVLHKLIVHTERPIEQRAKANKDLIQAACLMDYLLDNDPDLVSESWEDVVSRGPSWTKKLEKGCSDLVKTFPDSGFQERLKRQT